MCVCVSAKATQTAITALLLFLLLLQRNFDRCVKWIKWSVCTKIKRKQRHKKSAKQIEQLLLLRGHLAATWPVAFNSYIDGIASLLLPCLITGFVVVAEFGQTERKKKCNASQVWSCDRERERENETGGVGQRQSKWSRCEKRDQNKSQTTLLFLFLWLLLLCCCYLRFLPSLLLIMICYRVVIAVVAVSPLLASFICLIVLQWPRPRFMQMCKNDFNCRGERERERGSEMECVWPPHCC